MQINTDMLSRIANSPELVSSVKPKVNPNPQGGFQFEKALDKARAGSETQAPQKKEPEQAGQPNKDAAKETVKETAKDEKAVSNKTEKPVEEEVDENLAAGAMENQNAVVFILEGEKDSDTAPEMQIDAAGMIEAVEPEMPDDAMAGQTAYVAETAAGDAPVVAQQTESAVAETMTKSDQTVKTEQSGPEIDAAGIGEVTARMPAIRTTEKSDMENEEETEFSGNGNLSPLENENDKQTVKERKAFGKVEDTAQDTDKSVETPVSAAAAHVPGDIVVERFKADQDMGRVSNAPVAAENLFDQMVADIEMMNTESTRTMTIQLKPEFLGKVALEIAMDAAGLHVKIRAADENVRSMVNGQINALIETLQNKGFEVVEVEVAHTGADSGAFADTKGGQAQAGNPDRPHRQPPPANELAYYTTLPFDMLEYYLDADVSSVEYRA